MASGLRGPINSPNVAVGMQGRGRIFSLLAAALLLVPGEAFARAGMVKVATGAVSILRGIRMLPGAPGLRIEQGDVIVTGKNGRVGITFDDNSRFSIGPGSRVSVSQFAYNETTQRGEFSTQVDRGKLVIVSGRIAKSRSGAMKVRTPTTLLGVIGTKFLVVVE